MTATITRLLFTISGIEVDPSVYLRYIASTNMMQRVMIMYGSVLPATISRLVSGDTSRNSPLRLVRSFMTLAE